MPLRWPWVSRTAVDEARKTTTPASPPAQAYERLGYVTGIPQGGLNQDQAGLGASTQTDRSSMLQELYEAYLTCNWAHACVNATARTITAGGLVTDWDADDDEGDQKAPDKPANVLALERLLKYCNPTQDIRQLLRNAVSDLEVFGDAFIEVVWWGNLPVALYNLDCPTTTPVTDEHGVTTSYVQTTEFGQVAKFELRQVIHISLDSARPGVFGVSPTQAAMLPITAWLFFAACAKEMARKGLPPSIHADLPASNSRAEVRRWADEYVTENLGPSNIGQPITTKGGGTVTELQTRSLSDVLAAKNQLRDEIIATYGVPPAKVSIIESGNLGGGTGDAQDKTYRIDKCRPIAEVILEKLQYHLAVQAFGIEGWKLKFGDVDYRDSQAIEEIRDTRLRNGSWTLDRYRADIGEPPVDGGDMPVLVDRQNLVLWRDMADMSAAVIASKGAPAVAAGEPAPVGDEDDAPDAGGKPGRPPKPGKRAESVSPVQLARYRARLTEALRYYDEEKAAA